MKFFRLAGAGYKNNIDLVDYREDIEKAVKTVKPNAIVDVHQSYFTTTPDLGKRESIAVSTLLRHGRMDRLTAYRPCLFNSTPNKTKAEMEAEGNVTTNSNETRNTGRKEVAGRRRNTSKVSSNQQKGNTKADKRKS